MPQRLHNLLLTSWTGRSGVRTLPSRLGLLGVGHRGHRGREATPAFVSLLSVSPRLSPLLHIMICSLNESLCPPRCTTYSRTKFRCPYLPKYHVAC